MSSENLRTRSIQLGTLDIVGESAGDVRVTPLVVLGGVDLERNTDRPLA
jgi:hypothetical protein